MTVRRLRPGDLPAVLDLVHAEGWAFNRPDFEAMLDLEPDGLFVADVDDAVVGLTTTARYDDVGWIGNVVVAEDHRRKGLGTALVEAAMAHLREDGAEAVGLYALADSRPLYEGLGFEARGRVVSWTAETSGGASSDGNVPLATVLEVDRRHVHVDRSRYLSALHAQDGVRVAGDERGYLFARPGRVWELGPAVVDPDRRGTFAELLDAVLPAIDGPLEVSFPEENEAAREILRERGFEEAFDATTMTTAPRDLYDPQAVCGLLGLEKG